ncbi:hypothetical protein [Prochlorothrix hollandica]|uniref:hypothetical protein n=1 Tax=Prochlorothrix hollandica TaxID=1223 RepID=UPI0012B5AE64|nr:hypothetical protein [Prochlorothrix hollandica]
MVAPVGGRQEGRPGGENPTRDRWFQGEMHPVDPALTGDRGAETLLTFPLNTAVLNGSCGVRPEGAHHTKGFSRRDPYN